MIIKDINDETYKLINISFVRLSLALVFMLGVALYSFSIFEGNSNSLFLIIATVFGAYMAMNIGANDVANNIGPAVGSKAITLGFGIIIASIFEIAGAVLAGGGVVDTIKKDIIDINGFTGNIDAYVWVMISALLGAAIWLHFATYFKAPVSTTHSIVGGVMGAGIAATGFYIVSWDSMSMIISSWIISPLLGGLIAALFLFAIKKTIIFKEDKLKASIKWVPIFVSIMSWSFATYLTLKGLIHIWPSIVSIFLFLPQESEPSILVASSFGLFIAILSYFVVRLDIKRKTKSIKNSREGINGLFTIPLIFAAALLSFAHGANDLANAIGPLAAIHDAIIQGEISSNVPIELWMLIVGSIAIALGILLYGSKLIKTVGNEITKLDQIRAFSVAIATTVTVILASQLALPVSSTHIVVGAIFGIGFLRELLDFYRPEYKLDYEENLIRSEVKLINALKSELDTIEAREDKKKADYQRIISIYDAIEEEERAIERDKKSFRRSTKIKYVNRNDIKRITFAWIITIPVVSILSALIFFTIKGIMI